MIVDVLAALLSVVSVCLLDTALRLRDLQQRQRVIEYFDAVQRRPNRSR